MQKLDNITYFLLSQKISKYCKEVHRFHLISVFKLLQTDSSWTRKIKFDVITEQS